eukprot:8202486-Pyramimonas_sp.AAC.1
MVGALRPIKKVASPSPLLSIQTKVRYAETLGATRFLYAAGVWDDIPDFLARKLRAYHSQVYRTATNKGLRNHTRDQDSNDMVYLRTQRLAIDQVLSVARMRMLPSILLRAPPAVRVSIDALWSVP